MAAENLQTKQEDRRIRGLSVNPIEIENEIFEIRGLITALGAVFSSEPLISSDQDITDMYFAMQVLKDKFNKLTRLLGYGLRDDDNEVRQD